MIVLVFIRLQFSSVGHSPNSPYSWSPFDSIAVAAEIVMIVLMLRMGMPPLDSPLVWMTRMPNHHLPWAAAVSESCGHIAAYYCTRRYASVLVVLLRLSTVLLWLPSVDCCCCCYSCNCGNLTCSSAVQRLMWAFGGPPWKTRMSSSWDTVSTAIQGAQGDGSGVDWVVRATYILGDIKLTDFCVERTL